MKFSKLITMVLLCAMVGGCGPDEDSASHLPPPTPTPPPPSLPPPSTAIPFTFAVDAGGWEAEHADYYLAQEPIIGFMSGHQSVSVDLQGTAGLYTSATNRSDDEFMYVFRELSGLTPSTVYKVDVTISFATNAPPNCLGAGGAPGEGVTVKAGAASVRPATTVDAAGYAHVNFDKGNQAQGGANLISIGDFAQNDPGLGDCSDQVYKRKTLNTGTRGPMVRSDPTGRLWLVIGTDSGFEGTTKIYYLDGQVVLTPA